MRFILVLVDLFCRNLLDGIVVEFESAASSSSQPLRVRVKIVGFLTRLLSLQLEKFSLQLEAADSN